MTLASPQQSSARLRPGQEERVRRFGLLMVLSGLALIILTLFALKAEAQEMETAAREALLIDFDTGTVLLSKNAELPMPPSSMSKLMTSVMVFERLKEGSLSLDEMFRVSENAWRKGGAASGGSTMFLAPNSEARVEDLLRGIIIQSGNDACIVVAENLMGSEEAFAAEMTRHGRDIGLTGSVFMNATGLPEDNHVMTAHDLATLARYLITEYPEYYALYSETEFTYNGIRQGNRNPLLYTFPGADGLKTGHTTVAGYGLTASAQRDGRRLILVINGLESIRARSDEAAKLMEWGFRNFENRTLFTAGETVGTAPVYMGKADQVSLVVMEDLRLTVPRRAANDLTYTVEHETPLPAPIAAGAQVAVLTISGPTMEPVQIPVFAASEVEELGFFGRIWVSLTSMLFGMMPDHAE